MQQQQQSGANQYQPPGAYKVLIKVISAEGTCPNGHKVGDEFLIDMKTPNPPMCLMALSTLLCPIRILESGGSMPNFAESDTYRTWCPEPARLEYEIRRLPEKASGQPGEGQQPRS